MKNTKFRSMTITALVLFFALIFSLALGTVAPFAKASAEAKTYAPTTVFSNATGGTVSASEKDGEGNSYVQFALKKGGSVKYQRDLALKWFAKDSDSTEALANPGKVQYLTVKFSFAEVNFTKFSIRFEAEEENMSKGETSVNTLIFTNDNGVVKAGVLSSSMTAGDEKYVDVTVSDGVVLTLGEEGKHSGEFTVYVNGVNVGTITNIGENYLEYLSSGSDTPRVPLTFTADELVTGENAKDTLTILVSELNNQSLKLDEEGKIVDNAKPVLVLNEEVYAYTLGKKWSLSYEAIDVCDTSVSATPYYYILGADEKITEYEKLSTSKPLMPSSDTKDEQYISIRFQMTDDSGTTDNEDEYVYLTWYASKNAIATKGTGENVFDYILLNRNEEGPIYLGVDANEVTKTNIVSLDAEQASKDYQAMVDEVSADLSAGDGAYFYLPSLRDLIGSEHADYRNLSFSIYYYKQSQEAGATASSATSLNYNALKFEIDEVGQYVFCVIAKDSSSNGMKYYVDGELVEVTASNVWEIDEIPKFNFSVSYTGATVEETGEQTLGYKDSSYSFESFEIVALPGYKTEYTLYFVDDTGVTDLPYSSYADLANNIDKYFESMSSYLVEIQPYNSAISKDDEAWSRTDNDYNWNESSRSFTPVKVGFYILQLEITESALPGKAPVTAYQVVDVRNSMDTPPDVSNWLQNNLVSIILFSISAVLAIIIVILLVVKPSDTTVEEVDLTSLKKIEGRKQATLKNQKKEKDEE